MKRLVLFAMLCFLSLVIQGAGPIVHAFTAELFLKYIKSHYTQAQRDAFMRGALFPDIRYIAHLPREKTHPKKVTLDQVASESNPFKAGVLFHAYVDEQRSIIVHRHKIHEHLTDVPSKKSLFLKMLEDDLCYDKLPINTIRHALLAYDTEEKAYGTNFLHRIAWHKIQRGYFKQSPMTLLEHKVAGKKNYFSFTYDELAQALQLLKKHKNTPAIKRYTEDLFKTLETQISTYKAPTK